MVSGLPGMGNEVDVVKDRFKPFHIGFVDFIQSQIDDLSAVGGVPLFVQPLEHAVTRQQKPLPLEPPPLRIAILGFQFGVMIARHGRCIL